MSDCYFSLLLLIAAPVAGMLAALGLLASARRDYAAGDHRAPPDDQEKRRFLVLSAVCNTNVMFGLVEAVFLASRCGILGDPAVQAPQNLLLLSGICAALTGVSALLMGALGAGAIKKRGLGDSQCSKVLLAMSPPELLGIGSLVLFYVTVLGGQR